MLLFMYSFVCITFACSLKTSEYKGIFSPAGKYLSSRAAVIGRVVCLLFSLCCKAEVFCFFLRHFLQHYQATSTQIRINF